MKYYSPYMDVSTATLLQGLGFKKGSSLDYDLLVLTGGEDVSPEYYGEKNTDSYCNPVRDEIEFAECYRAFKKGKKMLGICRGAQVLNVLSDGKMIQHIPKGHRAFHVVTTHDGKERTVNSAHHQGIVPHETTEVLATHDDGVAEAIYIPKFKALGVQWHPEWLEMTHDGNRYFRELVKEYLDEPNI